MKVIIMDWDCYGKQDVIDTFTSLHWEVVLYPISPKIPRRNSEFEVSFSEFLQKENPTFVFSFNYFPIVSTVCNEVGIKYVSWVYDAPHASLYSCTMINTCNYVFVFDKALYFEFMQNGFSNVYYMPLAVNTKRLDNLFATSTDAQNYQHNISFVGSLYLEPKHNLFDRLTNISEETKGYLDGLIMSQLKVWGCNFVEECLSPELIDELYRSYPLEPHPDGVEALTYLYAQYMLNRKITSIDRLLALESLQTVGQVDLYTTHKEFYIPGVINHGPVDYEKEMPLVFKNSKINFNSTLRSIKSGIPLRVLDIMGAGGFLLTNFQADMLDYFEIDEDFVIFEDMNDLSAKAKYYLEHDEERIKIAENGYRKIKEYFGYRERIEEIIRITK